MSVWNKILLVLVAIASLAFFHAALRTLRTFDYWSRKAADFDMKLATLRKDIVQLRTADHDHPLPDKTFGVPQLRFDLDRMISNRGRIWANCQRKSIQRSNDGRVEVTVTSDEGNFADKMLLYLFEDDDQSPGKYLGEYSVKAINQTGQPSVVLVSTTQPTQIQLKSLQGSKSPWVLYEMMPADQHELFVRLPDRLREKAFPEPDSGMPKAAQEKWKNEKWWLPEEYVVDGHEVNGKIYERKLRDYLEVIRVCEVDRTLFDDRSNALKRDEGYLTAVRDDAQLQENFANQEKAQAIKERNREAKQHRAAADYYADLRTMLNYNETAVKDLIDANARYAQQIAKIQKEAAEQIDRRTHSMAHYGAGVN